MNSISKLLAICCIAVLLAGCGVSELAYAPTEGEPATIAWKKGDEEAANSEWEAAIASYTEAVRLRTNFTQAYLGRAKVYDAVGEMNSTDPAAIRIISRLRERLRSDTKHPGHLLKEAIISDLSEAIRLNPDLGPEFKSTLQHYQNIIDNKVVVMNESAGPRPTALQLDQAEGEPATIARKSGGVEAANSESAGPRPRTLQLDQAEGEPATIARKSGGEEAANSEWEAAIASYTEAIRLKTDLPQAYLGRAKVYDAVGSMKSTDPAAIRILTRLRERLRSDAKSGGLLLNEAIISDCSEAIRLNPDLGEAYNLRAVRIIMSLSRVSSPKREEYIELAISDSTELIRREPNAALFYRYRSRLYRQKGEDRKADADSTKYRELSAKPDK